MKFLINIAIFLTIGKNDFWQKKGLAKKTLAKKKWQF